MKSKVIITGTILTIMAIGLGSARCFNKTTIKTVNGNNSANQASSVKSNTIKLIPPEKFAELAKKTNAFVLDVHTPEQNHIPETDAFIPFDQIKDNQDKLPSDKTALILVYCRSGNMSSQAAQEIASLGYTNIYDLKGGTNAYKEQHISVNLWPAEHDLGTVIKKQ